MGRWARRWNSTVTSRPWMTTSAGMSMRSRKIRSSAKVGKGRQALRGRPRPDRGVGSHQGPWRQVGWTRGGAMAIHEGFWTDPKEEHWGNAPAY
jgi:hypothetical protein